MCFVGDRTRTPSRTVSSSEDRRWLPRGLHHVHHVCTSINQSINQSIERLPAPLAASVRFGSLTACTTTFEVVVREDPPASQLCESHLELGSSHVATPTYTRARAAGGWVGTDGRTDGRPRPRATARCCRHHHPLCLSSTRPQRPSSRGFRACARVLTCLMITKYMI